nr:uncharacterized protein LOC131771852 [Pocillopora verrucosa]
MCCEWRVITDARHDSSRSTAHTTVSALSFWEDKVLAVVNWSRANETSAVSCEVPMTKELLTYLFETQVKEKSPIICCLLQCRETYWIESLYSVMLIYAAKRIHHGDDTYNMCMELAILDWNENVNREASSLQMYQHTRHPNRLAETRVLTSKTFNFRETIWSTFFNINK